MGNTTPENFPPSEVTSTTDSTNYTTSNPDRDDDVDLESNTASNSTPTPSIIATTEDTITSGSETEQPSTKKLVATPAMCYYCFDILIDTLQHSASSPINNKTITETNNNTGKRTNASTTTPQFVNELPDESIECPIFITWEKQKNASTDNNSQWQLRGCIGNLSPRLLSTAVGEYAVISALKDRRFTPISLGEVNTLRVSVSLLVDYEECQNVYDWNIGIHGIVIKFYIHGHHYNATYLPEVAQQQQWDHIKTVSSLIRKGGYNGIIDDTLLKRIHCTRYKSSKCQISYDEYILHNCDGNDPIPHKTRPSWSPCNAM